MLSSTRASALAFNLAHRALPAESSRQGLLRAIAQQRAAAITGQKRIIHRRDGSTYATAVAFEENERVDHEEYEDWRIAARERNRRFPEPRPPDTVLTELAADRTGLGEVEIVNKEELPSLEGLREMMRSDPIQALRLFPRYRLSDLTKLSGRDLEDFLKDLFKPARNDKSGQNIDHFQQSQMDRSLEVLRGLLHDLPTFRSNSKQLDDSHLGRRFRTELLSRFLRICITLNSESVLRTTMKERLEAQKIEGKVIVKPDIWATELAKRQDWNLIIELLSPSHLPIESFTPWSIVRLMQAHIGIGDISKVPFLFRLYAELSLEPPPKAFGLLVQAHLVLGDLDTARQVMQQSLKGKKADEVEAQLAIMKGYRELGRDIAMEERVLKASEGMKELDEAAMLHALMRLRIDGGDETGARALLSRFDDDFWIGLVDNGGLEEAGERKLPANAQTHALGFRMTAPSMSMGHLKRAWQYLLSNSVPITDQIARTLFDTLRRLGRVGDARAVIIGKKIPSISMPEDYQPGSVILNVLLEHSGKTEGWRGFAKTLKVFRSRKVKPDSQTLGVVLEFIRENTTKDPTVLANLTNAIIRQSPELRPTVDHMDLLLGQAVRAHARASELAASSKTPGESTFGLSDSTSTSPQAGLNTRDPFSFAIRSIAQSLRARGARSMSRSLATRLRFDAQSHASMTAAPPVRAVWDDLIARGYKPDKKHFLALMKGYADSGHMVECEDVVLLAKDMGVEPSRGMWMVLMTSYGSVRRRWLNLTKAEKAFQAMRESRQGLDLPAVCAMIGIYQRSGHRQAAADLALKLIANIVNPSDNAISDIDRSPSRVTSWSIPTFQASDFSGQSLAITTNALRLDYPILALQVISSTYSTTLPTRVRDVVKSIRNRSRALITHGSAQESDYEAMTLSDKILASPIGAAGGRKSGAESVKRKIKQLFKRSVRGNKGRKVLKVREERKIRYQALTVRSVKPESVVVPHPST